MPKVLFCGGSTAGSVSPALAIASELKEQDSDFEFLFLGTTKGPEKELVQVYQIPFQPILAGKWRRYWDIRNLIDIFKVILAFFQSLIILLRFKPDLVFVAGSFVGVPVSYAAFLLRIPVFIHQLDIKPSLANKLIEPIATRISVSFRETLKKFPPAKTIFTGNPCRFSKEEIKKEEALKIFDFKSDIPTILILGGGTGALSLNKIVFKALPELVNFTQIIHLTGKGKKIGDFPHPHYLVFEFLTYKMKYALAAADLVIARAGMATFFELAFFQKPALLIPLPFTHQEINAIFLEKKGAVKMILQSSLTPSLLVKKIKNILKDPKTLSNLSKNIGQFYKKDAGFLIAREIRNIIYDRS